MFGTSLEIRIDLVRLYQLKVNLRYSLRALITAALVGFNPPILTIFHIKHSFELVLVGSAA